MKNYFVNSSLKLISNNYNYNQEMVDRIKYGLEIIYLSISKLGVVFIVSFICKCFKDTLIFFLFLSIIKVFAYGIHAKKSWQCYIASIIIFVLLPKIFLHLNFTIIQKVLFSIFSLLSMILFAPADTHKRPLVNVKHRKKLKFICISIDIVYSIMILILKSNDISNFIILALIVQSISINPITYKLFNMPYDNYKNFM